MDSLIAFLLKFSLFYCMSQTNRQVLKEFREELNKEKTSQSPVTIKTYEALTYIDKAIVDRYKDNYRKCDNAAFLSMHGAYYSTDGIKYRLKVIVKQLKNNISCYNESVEVVQCLNTS